MNTARNLFAALAAAALLLGCQNAQTKSEKQIEKLGAKSGEASVEAAVSQKTKVAKVSDLVSDWPARPKLAVQQMVDKYGEPTDASANHVTWMNAGPFKRIEVSRIESPHDFPKPHMDFLRHTIAYNIPIDKIDDLVAFDSSITVDKTAGELAAKSDREESNLLALNLSKDILDGRATPTKARRDFVKFILEDRLEQRPDYLSKLSFEPQRSAAYLDLPAIPGAPVRPRLPEAHKGSDAEIIALVIAGDDNEILATSAAEKEDISLEARELSRMLHRAHSENQAKMMKLSGQLGTPPAETKAVDNLRVKGAEDLAAIVALDGRLFEKKYVDALVKAHEATLARIDNQLLAQADDPRLRSGLKETRDHVAHHLELARKLQW